VKTDNAYVKADLVPINSEVSGPVIETLVIENQHVKAGQALFRLDPASFVSDSNFAEAKQNTDIAQQQIRVLEQDLQRIAQALSGDVTAPVEQIIARRFKCGSGD
jgi:multidrug resistance efflux pump